MNGKVSSFLRLRYGFSRVRAGHTTLPRQRLYYNVQVNPGRLITQVSLQGFVGQEVDFANVRTGRGANLGLGAAVRPTDHLELRLDESLRWLDVDTPSVHGGRLFTARVDRLRATYTFTPRAFARLIGQHVQTRRDPSLYLSPIDRRDRSLAASALFAYKLNWQTVLFAGYGDERALSDIETLEPSDRQAFFKISYAFQR
jgi:hypothetical protein